MQGEPGYLVLNTGDILEGKWLSEKIESEGELVFNTAMTGYQEVMTDLSYAGQIVTMTYPLIGNYGFNDQDFESVKPSLSGLIISNPCFNPAHYEAKFTIQDMVYTYNIPTLFGIDTRALTSIIRNKQNVFGIITTDKSKTPSSKGINPNLVDLVSTDKSFTVNASKTLINSLHIVVIDLGVKQSIIRSLNNLGFNVTVVPYNTTKHQIDQLNPDGVVISNGPGDPKDLNYLSKNIKSICDRYPTLGICLGHQLIALAYGGNTNRLPFGHRGSNHPVKDLQNGKVFITSQNHGYVVEQDSLDKNEWIPSHVNINDHSLEGMVHRYKPILSVQFHPEAHPGPVDSYQIFKKFTNMISSKGVKRYA